ncbi:hypothetical protein MLD38_030678 [Melastoma candidum]|uniref:Uncharacterized protein n=1 Tax=Melastoma candidum TaxID=119954 RepID=A0ACB9MPA3_9MYRT|nr:hypothetical protein MLD38_030678 [Melastoma candidum]
MASLPPPSPAVLSCYPPFFGQTPNPLNKTQTLSTPSSSPSHFFWPLYRNFHGMISNTYSAGMTAKNTPGIPPRHAGGGSRDRPTRRTPGIPPRDKEAAAAVYQERKKGKLPGAGHSRKQSVGEDINDSAEAFIRKFRQELARQRVESNNRKKLARGL